MKPLDKIELAQLQVLREEKTERSRALEADRYRDPSKTVKFEREKERGRHGQGKGSGMHTD